MLSLYSDQSDDVPLLCVVLHRLWNVARTRMKQIGSEMMSSLEHREGVFRLSSFWFLLCQVVCSKHRSYVVWAVHRQGFVSRVKSRHVHRDWFQMSARIMNLNFKSGPQWFTSMNPSNDKDTWKCSNIIHTSVVTYFFFYSFEVSMLSNRVHVYMVFVAALVFIFMTPLMSNTAALWL